MCLPSCIPQTVFVTVLFRCVPNRSNTKEKKEGAAALLKSHASIASADTCIALCALVCICNLEI